MTGLVTTIFFSILGGYILSGTLDDTEYSIQFNVINILLICICVSAGFLLDEIEAALIVYLFLVIALIPVGSYLFGWNVSRGE